MPQWVCLSFLVLTLVKVWLTASQTVLAIGGSAHDDFHFLEQASYLVQGQWLGPYDNLTLIKGPFFSAWIALTFLAGVPLLLSAQLLYAFSCCLVVLAARPLLSRSIHSTILFGLLLFNPVSNSIILTRLLREMLTPALTLSGAACAIGLLLHGNGNERKGWYWAAGLGGSLGALWLTREEQLVVVPFLLWVLGGSVVLAWKEGGAQHLWRVLKRWLLALGFWAVIVHAVAITNYVHYGVFSKTEFDAKSFQAAYGALTRVKPDIYRPFVPVSRETRLRIYRRSPAFKKLKPYLEGEAGIGWAAMTAPLQDETNQGEILGPWFWWALRDAVSRAGFYEEGRYPEEYYSRVAREVNSACDKDLLDCRAPRATFAPVWDNSYIWLWPPSFGDKLIEVIGFRAVGLDPVPSQGAPGDLALFRRLTRSPIAPPDKYWLEVEAVGKDSQVEFQIRDEDGEFVDFAASRHASPELRQLLASDDDAAASARNSRYLLAAVCSEECTLDIFAGDAVHRSIRFGDLQTVAAPIVGQDLVYRIVSVERPAAPLPSAARLGASRHAGLWGILRAYQIINPILAIAALVTYARMTVTLGRRRLVGRPWIVLSGFLILGLSRIGFTAFLNIAHMRIPPGTYMYEAYPAMLAFSGLACLGALKGVSASRP